MNLKNFTGKSFWKNLFSWKKVSLFEKAFFASFVVTNLFFLAFALPGTRPRPTDLSNELSPQMLETASLIWMAPCAVAGLWLMKLGMNLEYIKGGLWMVALVNTFFWAFVFWFVARAVKFVLAKGAASKNS